MVNLQNHGDIRGESSLEGEIQQVEDLMLMEALRLSVLEEQARRERWVDNNSGYLMMVVCTVICG